MIARKELTPGAIRDCCRLLPSGVQVAVIIEARWTGRRDRDPRAIVDRETLIREWDALPSRVKLMIAAILAAAPAAEVFCGEDDEAGDGEAWISSSAAA